MKIRKQHLKEFFRFSFLDVVFCLAVTVLFLPYDKDEYELVTGICGWFIIAYILGFLYQNAKFFIKLSFPNKFSNILALFFSLNFLALLIVFSYSLFIFPSFDIKRLLYLNEPRVIILYLWGIITITSLVWRDRYKKRLEKTNL